MRLVLEAVAGEVEASTFVSKFAHELLDHYIFECHPWAWPRCMNTITIDNDFLCLSLSTGNTWCADIRDQMSVEYEGSRYGFWCSVIAKTVFLRKARITIDGRIIEIDGPYVIIDIGDGDWMRFKVIDYETSAPPEWGLEWYELVIRVYRGDEIEYYAAAIDDIERAGFDACTPLSFSKEEFEKIEDKLEARPLPQPSQPDPYGNDNP